MKIKDGFVLEEVAGSYVAVALGKEAQNFNGFVKMNSTGAFLWKLLSQKDCDENTLVTALLENYDVDEKTARADVLSLIEKLKGANILK
jgi:hypothetical protein